MKHLKKLSCQECGKDCIASMNTPRIELQDAEGKPVFLKHNSTIEECREQILNQLSCH